MKTITVMSYQIWYDYLWWTDTVQIIVSWFSFEGWRERRTHFKEEVIPLLDSSTAFAISISTADAWPQRDHELSLSLSILVQGRGEISPPRMKRWTLSWVRWVHINWQSVTASILGMTGNYSVGKSLDEALVWGCWCLLLTTRHPFSNLGCHNNQTALLVPNTTDSFMVMIIISQFALQAEIWFTFPEEIHHMTCKMSERE